MQVQFVPTSFYMLDALESDIKRAKSESDILDIYREYFRDSIAVRRVPSSTQTTHFRTEVDRITNFRITPERADPDGTQRTKVFLDAVKRRSDIDPKITTDATLEAIIKGLVDFEAEQERKAAARLADQAQGPCQSGPIPRKTSSPDHDEFARFVSGQTDDKDFEVKTPSGLACAYDGQDATNPLVVWEVKTRHEWATPQGIMGSIFSPRIQVRLSKMEIQIERCRAVAQRCGFTYRWAFETGAPRGLCRRFGRARSMWFIGSGRDKARVRGRVRGRGKALVRARVLDRPMDYSLNRIDRPRTSALPQPLGPASPVEAGVKSHGRPWMTASGLTLSSASTTTSAG